MTESEHLKIHSSIKAVTLEKLVKSNFSRTLEINQSFQKSKENLFKKNCWISLGTMNFVAFLFAFSHPPLHNTTVVSQIGSLTTPAAAAAAKSLQSCPTPCNPIDGSTGSPVPGILLARTLEWVAISFSNLTTPLTTKTSDLAATRGGRVGVKLPKKLCSKRTVTAWPVWKLCEEPHSQGLFDSEPTQWETPFPGICLNKQQLIIWHPSFLPVVANKRYDKKKKKKKKTFKVILGNEKPRESFEKLWHLLGNPKIYVHLQNCEYVQEIPEKAPVP